MASVSVTSVSKTYTGSTALHPVDLDIPDGSFCCMLGSSGSGKSTLLRIIAGLTAPDAGSVLIGDRDVTRLPTSKRRIGFVFQNYALFPHLSVLENVSFGLRARGTGRADSHRKALELLALVGLEGFEKRSPRQLSGGQQQRVALARALVTDPDVLLLDEPLSALDRKIRSEMQRELKRIHEETGLTTIMVTHDQEEAMSLGDMVLMLDHGKIQQLGEPRAIYDAPASPFVADFLGAATLGTGTVVLRGEQTYATVAGQTLPVNGSGLRAGEEALVVAMSERIGIVPAQARSIRDGELAGTLASLEFSGPLARATVRVGELTLPVLLTSQQLHGVHEDVDVWVDATRGALHAFPVATTGALV